MTRKWPSPSQKVRKIAFGAACFLLGAALSSPEAISQAMTRGGKVTDEIREFCSNIADAAKDRRYALQVQELEKLKKDIDVRVEKLEAKRAEYEKWLKRRDDFLARAEDNVVEIYSKMKPDAAAERLASVDPVLAAGILMKLDPREAGVILNEMKTKPAAELTGVMAAVANPRDPS